jgi:hypothetical protein
MRVGYFGGGYFGGGYFRDGYFEPNPVTVTVSVDKAGKYSVQSPFGSSLSGTYLVSVQRSLEEVAAYIVQAGHSISLSANYELFGVVIYPNNSSTPVSRTVTSLLEEPPPGAQDLWLKGPFSLYITINSQLKKLPDSVKNRLLSNNNIYRWTYGEQGGKFLFKQDLPAPKILVESGDDR